MSAGIVKSFDSARGYGFIQPDNGSQQVSVHASTVEQAGMETLWAWQKVSYLLRYDPKTRKDAASDLRARGGAVTAQHDRTVTLAPAAPEEREVFHDRAPDRAASLA